MMKTRRMALCGMLALLIGLAGFTVCTVGSPTTVEAATCLTCNGTVLNPLSF